MNTLGGYGQTKNVSEYHLSENKELNYEIFRPGTISGHSSTQYTNPNDFWTLFFLACLALQCYPENSKYYLSWIPVDYVVKRIVYNSDKKGSVHNMIGMKFHMDLICQKLKQKTELKLIGVDRFKWCDYIQKLT
eukprot:UN08048